MPPPGVRWLHGIPPPPPLPSMKEPCQHCEAMQLVLRVPACLPEAQHAQRVHGARHLLPRVLCVLANQVFLQRCNQARRGSIAPLPALSRAR